MSRQTKLFLFLAFTLVYLSSDNTLQRSQANAGQAGLCEKLKPCQLLIQADAEKILRQSVRLTQDVSDLKDGIRQCRCTYTGISKDAVSGRDINLFFSLERLEVNPTVEQARQVMDSTKAENAHDLTIVNLPGIGDEAFRLGDQPTSQFIMARKGAIIIRLQINQATEQTSFEELKAFAQKVTKQL